MQLVGDGPEQWRVQNDSDFALSHLGLLYRTSDGQLQICRLDQLPAKASADVQWSLASDDRAWVVRGGRIVSPLRARTGSLSIWTGFSIWPPGECACGPVMSAWSH